jgi:S-adenosylmethionine:diacylglycerol 3-amino-3-carboxypropyl transferase
MNSNMKTEPRTFEEWTRLDTKELRKATARFDKPSKSKQLPGKPLTPAQRKVWQKAKRRGRPRVGAGSRRVQITLEQKLLTKTDALAKEQGLNRSQVISLGLRRVLAEAG